MSKSDTAVIHFETQRANKTRWVKAAQREGLGLAAWIERTLDAASEPLPDRVELQILEKIARREETAGWHAPGTAPHTKAMNAAKRARRELACWRATGSLSAWTDYEPAGDVV